jgi:hypothetical protein
MAAKVDDLAARRAQLGERAGADEAFGCDGSHRFLLCHQKRGSAGSDAASSSSVTSR